MYNQKYSDFTFILNEKDADGNKKRKPVHKFILSRYPFFEDCLQMCGENAESSIDCNENVMNFMLSVMYKDDTIPYEANILDDCDSVIACHKYLNEMPKSCLERIGGKLMTLDHSEYSIKLTDKIMAIYRISKTTRKVLFGTILPEFFYKDLTFDEIKEIGHHLQCYFEYESLRSILPRPNYKTISAKDISGNRYEEMVKVYGKACIQMKLAHNNLKAHISGGNLLVSHNSTEFEVKTRLPYSDILSIHSHRAVASNGDKIYAKYHNILFLGVVENVNGRDFQIKLKHRTREKLEKVGIHRYTGVFSIILYECPITPIPNPYGCEEDE